MKRDCINGVMIQTSRIHPHPDNPRKDLGDLEELTESIRKNGIMQNLTIIPKDEDDDSCDEYIALIGHRRLAAAKEAHVYDVPCNIVFGLSKKEQLGIMLEENMQRSDLTPIEQAFGFQMMLDLGETEESIAEKTGFSRTTVRHRLEIAKLDKRILQETEEFQLSIGDLIALEQIKSIARRNAVLNMAKSSAELRSKAAYEARVEQIDNQKEELIKKLEAAGITHMPEKLQTRIWSDDLEQVKCYDLDKEIPEEIDLEPGTKQEPLYWTHRYGTEVQVYRKVKKEKKEPTEYDIRLKEQKGKREKLKDIMRSLADRRKAHVKGMLDGSLERIRPTAENWERLFSVMYEHYGYIGEGIGSIREFLTGKQGWQILGEEEKEVDTVIGKMKPIEKLLALIEHGVNSDIPFSDYGDPKYREDIGEPLKRYHSLLEEYGFTIDDEETLSVLDGTNEYYEKEEK